jgi:hydroxymethylpyrimidine/phosphomethylpyrimidine kinase
MNGPPIALTVAGSDSGGGAGIQADLTTMAALGAHGTSVLTVVTAQNTVGVQALYPLPEHVVEEQLASLLADLPPAAVKCGLLGTPGLVATIAGAAARGALPRPVVDPVLVATSGDRLTSEATDRVVSAYVETLLPHSALVTPNTDEAAALLGGGVVDSPADRRSAAKALLALGPEAVVVTGGDAHGDCVDVYADADGIEEWSEPAVPTKNDHGTGCTYSAAVAAYLAHGLDLRTSAQRARAYVRQRLEVGRTWELGAGHGPVAHTCTGADLPRPPAPERAGKHAETGA